MAAPCRYSYVIEAPGGPYAFVPHPAARGLWIRTHPCVLAVACAHCSTVVGEPCRNKASELSHGYTHYIRRRDGRAAVAKLHWNAVLTISKKKESSGS